MCRSEIYSVVHVYTFRKFIICFPLFCSENTQCASQGIGESQCLLQESSCLGASPSLVVFLQTRCNAKLRLHQDMRLHHETCACITKHAFVSRGLLIQAQRFIASRLHDQKQCNSKRVGNNCIALVSRLSGTLLLVVEAHIFRSKRIFCCDASHDAST